MAELRRIARLRRLEKVRAIARQTAAAEAAQAEGTFAQLQALAGRTAALAQGYAARTDMGSGLELNELVRFAANLEQIRTATAADAQAALTRADAAQLSLARAERRRAAVEQRADLAVRALQARSAHGAAGARQNRGTPDQRGSGAIGTGLETDLA